MSLYRKHRPQKFIDLIGQEHIVQTLVNSLTKEQFSHAYIFYGPKGTGKTTVARLLAKALNCSGRNISKDFEPCDKCFSCTEIIKGNNLDMIEIDAASNRGIDEIRDLREKIRFAPTANKYKVYIIDECHMLTKEAFNALLKTLEEPPKHAVFILATTELHKVPPTIISRTQGFEFRKASMENILKLLKSTVEKEKLNISLDGLKLIAKLSSGAYRDGLSLLDQISVLGESSQEITIEMVQQVLGQTTEIEVQNFVKALSKNDRKSSLEIIQKISQEGKDLENFLFEVINIFRKTIFIKEEISLEFELTSQEEKYLKEITRDLEINQIVKIIEKLSQITNEVKSSVLGQLPLEMAVFELTQNNVHSSPITAHRKEEGNNIGDNKNASVKIESNIKKEEAPKILQVKDKEKDEVKKASESSESESTKINAEKWQEVVKLVKAHNNTIAATLKSAVFSKTTDHHIELMVKFPFHAEQICNKKNLLVIEDAVKQATGNNYKIDCIVNKELKVEKPKEDEEQVLETAKEIFEVE